MWFMIPTPPYLVDGIERGSARNRRFALRTDEEVREYLRPLESSDSFCEYFGSLFRARSPRPYGD